MDGDSSGVRGGVVRGGLWLVDDGCGGGWVWWRVGVVEGGCGGGWVWWKMGVVEDGWWGHGSSLLFHHLVSLKARKPLDDRIT